MYDIQGVYFSPPDRKAKVNFFCGHPVVLTVSVCETKYVDR